MEGRVSPPPRTIPWKLLALWAVVLAATLLWLSLDRRPFAWDESVHYMGAAGYYRTLRHPGPDTLRTILYQSDFYPPLQEFLTGAWFLITGPSPRAAAVFNVFYLLLITWLLWLVGRRLDDENAGLTAAFLTAASAAFVIQSKFLMLDIPLAFWVLLGLYCFLRSEGFSQRSWALAYGLTFGMALLTKWSAIFFLALPPVGAGLAALYRRERGVSRVWINLGGAYLLAGLLAAPWYLAHLAQMARHARGVAYVVGVVENDPPVFSPASWLYYLGACLELLSWPLALLVLAGLVWSLWRRHRPALWALWLGAPYVLLTLIRNKDGRYLMPLLPLLCLAAMLGTRDIPEPGRRRLHAGLTGLALLQLLYVNFGVYAGPLRTWLSQPVAGRPLIQERSPDASVWPIGTVLDDVLHAAESWHRKPVLRVIPDHASFTRFTFIVEQSRRPDARVLLTGGTDWPAFTDFAVTKTGALALPFLVEQPRRITGELEAAAAGADPRFEVIRRYPLPDGSEALLYSRRDVRDPGPPAKILDELHLLLTRLLARYVKDADQLSVDIIPISAEQTLAGRFQAVRIRARSARVGDFAHKPLGVTIRNLDLELSGLALDLNQARREKLIPYELDELAVNHLEMDADALNRSLAAAGGDASRVQAAFEDGRLRVEWAGRPQARVELALRVVPDTVLEGSDNLRFDLKSVRVSRLPLPARLLQPLAEDFNPLFKLAGWTCRVRLGGLKVENGKLELGREVK